MSFNATVLNVMIASPGDVATERQNIRNVIDEWNTIHAQDRQIVLLPMGWETHASPMMGDRGQAIINKQILEHCDLLVAVFWTRLGSPTGEASSGTVEEITKHLDAGKPAMIYFSNAPVRPDSVDEDQYRALRDFKKECQRRGLTESYDSLEEFRAKFARQLTQTVLRQFKDVQPLSAQEVQDIAQQPQAPALSAEARQLLLEAAKDPNGTVLYIRTFGGAIVETNGKGFTKQGDPRSEAQWKAAIDDLTALGLLEPRGYKGEVFGITHAGYQAAERLSQTA